jgi:hypothetical protein
MGGHYALKEGSVVSGPVTTEEQKVFLLTLSAFTHKLIQLPENHFFDHKTTNDVRVLELFRVAVLGVVGQSGEVGLNLAPHRSWSAHTVLFSDALRDE